MIPHQVTYVRGYRLSSGADSHELKPYVYNGTQPYVPPTPKLCAAPSCETLAATRGLCGPHYHHHVKKGRPLDEPVTDHRRGTFRADKCGSYAGYNRHVYYGVPLCDPCKEAQNQYQRDRAEKKRKQS